MTVRLTPGGAAAILTFGFSLAKTAYDYFPVYLLSHSNPVTPESEDLHGRAIYKSIDEEKVEDGPSRLDTTVDEMRPGTSENQKDLEELSERVEKIADSTGFGEEQPSPPMDEDQSKTEPVSDSVNESDSVMVDPPKPKIEGLKRDKYLLRPRASKACKANHTLISRNKDPRRITTQNFLQNSPSPKPDLPLGELLPYLEFRGTSQLQLPAIETLQSPSSIVPSGELLPYLEFNGTPQLQLPTIANQQPSPSVAIGAVSSFAYTAFNATCPVQPAIAAIEPAAPFLASQLTLIESFPAAAVGITMATTAQQLSSQLTLIDSFPVANGITMSAFEQLPQLAPMTFNPVLTSVSSYLPGADVVAAVVAATAIIGAGTFAINKLIQARRGNVRLNARQMRGARRR